MEIICVDDGSNDSSVQIVNSLSQKYPFVKLIKLERNQGTLRCRKEGLRYAKGRYIAQIDPDDEVFGDIFKKGKEILEKNPYDILEFDMLAGPNKQNLKKWEFFEIPYGENNCSNILKNICKLKNHWTLPRRFIKRSVFLD